MAEFKTLQFPNTTTGQRQKVKTLNQMSQEGWQVVSENITQAQFKTDKAACLSFSGIFCCGPIGAALGLTAGHTDGTINVTVKKE